VGFNRVAMTLGITHPSIHPFSLNTLSKMTFSLTTLGIMTINKPPHSA
jgi:hypothetical protein